MESEASAREFGESSDDGFFSDSDDAEPSSSRRHYTPRRKESCIFLGKQVCSRACARLLGVGQSTLQKLRSNDKVYVQKTAQSCAKHPAFGFSMRGQSNEQSLDIDLEPVWFSIFLDPLFPLGLEQAVETKGESF